MAILLPPHLPAINLLRQEDIEIDYVTLSSPPVLKIALLNLMPVKPTTETDFVRLLSASPLSMQLDLIKIKNHISKNTPESHLQAFYKNFEDVCHLHYDGLIVTGAPVELLAFEKVHYWDELCEIFDWAHRQIRSTLYICWAAQAALYHFYGVPKYPLAQKMFGIFPHHIHQAGVPLFRGFDDVFFAPHSRHTEIRSADILKIPELQLLSESDESGVYVVMADKGRDIFITGHSEYAPETLHNEYMRDLSKGLSITMPKNYYVNDCIDKGISVRWRAHANLLFSNWLNYYVLP